MARNPFRELAALGQSLWLDHISRGLFGSERFRSLPDDDGLKGMTSNPTIFEKGIAGLAICDEQLYDLARGGNSVDAIYEAITQTDIGTAADAPRSIYDESEGRFGYVSHGVSPELSRDTAGNLNRSAAFLCRHRPPQPNDQDSRYTRSHCGRRATLAEGRNINVTLMFSMGHYDAVADAYLRGL